MTSYSWTANGGGSFDDPSNWFNTSDMQANDGSPGAGDTAFLDDTQGNVTVSGDSVANLSAFGTHIVGSIDVTDMLTGGVFSGGSDTFGTANASTFNGGTINADTVLQCIFMSGSVIADVLDTGYVQGGTVSVQSIERVSSDELDSDDYLTISSGSLTSMTMDLFGDSDERGADYFDISGGAATITGEASATGDGVDIVSEGGTLKFKATLTLSDGATFKGKAGGTTKIDDLIIGDSGDDSLVNLKGAGTTMTVAGNVDAGGDGEGTGDITVSAGATMTVGGAMTLGEYAGGSSTLTLTGASTEVTVAGNLIVGDDGSATLVVENGATLNVEGEIFIGDQGAESGADPSDDQRVTTVNSVMQLTGDGTLTTDETYVVGDNQNGELDVFDGFQLLGANNYLILGQQANGSGQVRVSGSLAKLTAGVIYVGQLGSGRLKVLDIGKLRAGSVIIGGGGSGAVASVVVSDSDLSANKLKFAPSGKDSLTVEDVGIVYVHTLLQEQASANATITIDGTSSIIAGNGDQLGGYLSVGSSGEVDLRSQKFSGSILIDGGTLNLDATDAAGSEKIRFASGTLNVASGVNFFNTVGGFNSNDTINLFDVATNRNNFANGVLTLLENNSIVGQLNFAGTYSATKFHVNSNIFTDVTTITYG